MSALFCTILLCKSVGSIAVCKFDTILGFFIYIQPWMWHMTWILLLIYNHELDTWLGCYYLYTTMNWTHDLDFVTYIQPWMWHMTWILLLIYNHELDTWCISTLKLYNNAKIKVKGSDLL